MSRPKVRRVLVLRYAGPSANVAAMTRPNTGGRDTYIRVDLRDEDEGDRTNELELTPAQARALAGALMLAAERAEDTARRNAAAALRLGVGLGGE